MSREIKGGMHEDEPEDFQKILLEYAELNKDGSDRVGAGNSIGKCIKSSPVYGEYG